MSCRIHHIAWITLVILSSAQDVLALAWIEQPADTNSVIGGDAEFICNFSGASLSTWTRPGGTLFVNNVSMTTDSRFSITGHFNLHIRNVKKEDQGEYTCTVQNLQPVGKGYLNVYIPPHNISVVTNDTRPSQIEGDYISLTCSAIGNPRPEITWYREDAQLLDSSMTQIIEQPSIGHGDIETQVTSQLIIKLQYTDHNKNFYCSARNEVNLNNPSKVPFLVQVQYKPRITLEPSPLNILLGSSKQLRCIVSANPVVSRVRWQKDTQTLTNTDVVLPFTSVERTAAGHYTCSASNIVNGQTLSASDSTTVRVIYEPVITVPATVVVNETGELHLHCAVDANPPPLSVKWKKLDNSRESISANFTASPVTQAYAGNYTCIVVYRLEPSGGAPIQDQKLAYTYVHVQYKPGYSSIKAVSNPVNIGDTLSLTCSVSSQGYPAPKYRWKKIGSNEVFSEQGATLTIDSARLSNNGQYACTPFNVAGDGGTSTIIVEVQERPQFVEYPPTSQTISSDQPTYSVLCKVRGLPKPRIEWLKDGMVIQSGPQYNITESVTPVETYSKLVISQLRFAGTQRQGLMVDDIGNFTCRELLGGEQHNLELYIMFKPSVDTDEKVATTVNQSTTMTCRGRGYPAPTFEWYRDNKIILTGSRYTVDPTTQVGPTEAVGSLSIRDVVAGDFGAYVCIAQNSNGQAHKTVLLTVKNRPEAPYNLSVISYTWESVYIGWTPGFNGGETQSFFIHFTSSVPPIYTGEITVSPPAATRFNITGLMPGVAYQFFVYGKNSLGKGNNSQKLIIKTKDFAFPLVKNTPDYSAENKKLKIPFTLNSTYCVKVKISVNGGSTWQTIPMSGKECFPASEETAELSLQSDNINRLNVSICLSVRPDVCGVHLAASISDSLQYGFQRQSQKTDLTETEVIIIGVICAVILLSLIIVLIVIICRRRTNAKDYGNSSTTVSRPVPNLQTNGNSVGPPKPQRGPDNQGIDFFHLGGVGVAGSRGVSHYSNHTYCSLGNGFDPPPQYQSVINNGSIPLDTSYDSQLAKYENEMNMRNMHNLKNEAYYGVHNGSPSTPRKDPHHFLEAQDRKDLSKGGQESGYSTPEGQQQKPKKVIYEVVV
ncbi:hemicentin-1-like isoform X1 [Crassostrea angulata]|uniref:hemicentin-1-like isoform X1 n=1 Tax=Magallana angulata TaxID=2784310 RepID=UPI0022B19DBA|nr:hemicentin-1-like isoform X1 [Crassostrea angulata]XP_052674902.1 hemicentin-1-like isoform X1 [Crassostrea angulata]XP_052674903.1 hemicentin-1-like isoform X1 [Crassostrea angulata]XP_052674904.1 hemicentin-1-like isoform X1 [Crassostrea angulata]XP_052674906.1 hemicentin-1-like isoform X1 [Crassostrea angulata]